MERRRRQTDGRTDKRTHTWPELSIYRAITVWRDKLIPSKTVKRYDKMSESLCVVKALNVKWSQCVLGFMVKADHDRSDWRLAGGRARLMRTSIVRSCTVGPKDRATSCCLRHRTEWDVTTDSISLASAACPECKDLTVSDSSSGTWPCIFVDGLRGVDSTMRHRQATIY